MSENEAKPVYCDDCRHFCGPDYQFGKTGFDCFAPQNGTPNWRSPRGIKLSPANKNCKNDCEWFVPRKRDNS